MPTISATNKTGCFDLSGDEIFVNDIVLVKSERTGRKIITSVVERRTDGIRGFRIRTNDGYLEWAESDHDACYEVMKINSIAAI